MHQYERAVMLQSLDTHWREHLAALDHLRQGIHLRGYAQKNPKQEYKREAFELFTAMLEEIKAEVTRILMTVQIRSEQQVEAVAETQQHLSMYSTIMPLMRKCWAKRSRRRKAKLRSVRRSSNRLCGTARRLAAMIPVHVGQEKNISNATASSASGGYPITPLNSHLGHADSSVPVFAHGQLKLRRSIRRSMRP